MMVDLDIYNLLKALHVASVMIFVGGMLGAAVFLNAAGLGHSSTAQKVRQWDQLVTTPAMLLVWTLGLSLGLMGEWFRDGWLIAKLAFVIALSGAHGMQSAKLRRMAGGISATPASALMALVIVGSVVAIAMLVIVKPF